MKRYGISLVSISRLMIPMGILLYPFTIITGQDDVVNLIKQYQYNVKTDGKKFLLDEAQKASFFLLGELHGEKEIPDLLYSIWPVMNRIGYKHIAAEISPWTAHKLEFGAGNDTLKTEVLWTNREARFMKTKDSRVNNPTILGCDMEEVSLGLLLRELNQQNPKDTILSKSLKIAGNDYNRKKSPDLLAVLKDDHPTINNPYNKISLFDIIINSLKIDSSRNYSDSRLKAQILREDLMKRYFLAQYTTLPENSKIMVRFGRNHLHRGFDSRGISTLGNFVSEYAFSKGLKCFNVAAFSAGGSCKLLGDTFDADERGDDLAFNFLYEQATYDATVFDLGPLRIYLHAIDKEKRTDLQNRLLYWADSYDAIICYKEVTPR